MTREELIAALEKATGPDWRLDLEIFAATIGVRVSDLGCGGTIPEYTASIDAALTLVPESSFVQLSIAPRDKRKLAVAYVAANNVNHQGGGDTPAIALCIAALRAMEAPHDGQG